MINQEYLTFLVVAEAGSFSQAAKKLYLSPVSVKKQIDKLEFENTIKLFTRTNHGVQLTRAGQMLYQRTKRLKYESEQILEEVKTVAEQDKINIRVGASMMRPATHLINLWQKHVSSCLSKYNLQIIPLNDDDFTLQRPTAEIGQKVDCVVGPYDLKEWLKQYNVLRLGEDRFKLAVPLNSPLSKKKLLQLNDLRDMTILTPSRDSQSVNHFCQEMERKYPSIKLRSLPLIYNAETFFEHPNNLILTRMGFDSLSSAFKTIAVNWSYTSPTGLIYSKEASDEVKTFIAVLHKIIEQSSHHNKKAR